MSAVADKKKQMHLVIGVRGTGSGSLTWPEDFAIVAVYTSEKEADAHALLLNDGKDPFAGDEDDYDDLLDEDESYELQYQSWPVELMTKAPVKK